MEDGMNMAPTRGVLFADAQQRTIFVDTNLQKMLFISETDLGYFIGEPVHKLLGITTEIYNDLTRRLQKAQQVDMENLELRDQDGNLLTVSVDCTANRDASGNLMGIDLTINNTLQATDTVDNSISVISSKMAEELVRYYFKRQLEGLYEIMTHVGGKRLGQYLVKSINTTADQNGWNLEMSDSTIHIRSERLSFDAYQGLLFKAASYASTAIGSKIVGKRIAQVDERANPKTFDYIQQDWFQQRS
jgi:hypothetical protein